MTTINEFMDSCQRNLEENERKLSEIQENKSFHAHMGLLPENAIRKAVKETEECKAFHRALEEKENAEQAWKNSKEKFDLEEFMNAPELADVRKRYEDANNAMKAIRTWYHLKIINPKNP